MSDKEKQLKKEEAEKVSGGHFEPMYGGIGPDSYESETQDGRWKTDIPGWDGQWFFFNPENPTAKDK